MKRNMAFMLTLFIFIGIPLLTKASDTKATSSGIKSIGNIVYQGRAGSVELYAEDIALLEEKLASVPDEIFNPILYSHMHSWEYTDITAKRHTKHCAGCGSSHDIIEQHQVAKTSNCMIPYDDEEYIGRAKVCDCGYEWKEEMYHNLVYDPKDDETHMVSCALSGTEYCNGMSPMEEEHSMVLYATDESHHLASCSKCGFTGKEEECVFDEEITVDRDDETLDPEVRKYCKCGNYITESSSGGEEPDPEEPNPEEPDPDEGEDELKKPDPPDPSGTETEGSEEIENSEKTEEQNTDDQTETESEGGML